jgi:hypothetical protein
MTNFSREKYREICVGPFIPTLQTSAQQRRGFFAAMRVGARRPGWSYSTQVPRGRAKLHARDHASACESQVNSRKYAENTEVFSEK